jgi:hypothetical protein
MTAANMQKFKNAKEPNHIRWMVYASAVEAKGYGRAL